MKPHFQIRARFGVFVVFSAHTHHFTSTQTLHHSLILRTDPSLENEESDSSKSLTSDPALFVTMSGAVAMLLDPTIQVALGCILLSLLVGE